MSSDPNDIIFDANELLDGLQARPDARARNASIEKVGLLIRLPESLRASLTIEAARRTADITRRVSLNTLIVELLTQSLTTIETKRKAKAAA